MNTRANRNKLFSVRCFGLIAIAVVLISGVFFTIKNRSGAPAVLVPMDTGVGPEKRLPTKIDINPLPPNQNNVAPPPFVPKELPPPPNNNVGEAPVINEPSKDSRRGDTSAIDEANDDDSPDDLEIPLPDQGDSKDLTLQLQEKQMVGRVNYDLWWNVVGYYVDDLRIYKYFPNQPDERKFLEKLHVDFHDDSINSPKARYSHKVYGYFLPPKPGVYLFKFVMDKLTAAASAELWISPSPSPLDTQKCLVLEYDDLSRPTKRMSTILNKEADYKFTGTAHYFEFLMKAFEGKAIVDLLWKPPGFEEFVPIPSSNMAMAVQLNADGGVIPGEVARILHDPLPSSRLQTHHKAYYVGNIIYPISDLDVLPQCDFSAQYAYPRRVKAYTGVNQVKGSLVYPKDDTWFKNWHDSDKGNPVIEQEKVDQVMLRYNEALNKSSHKGRVSQLVNMEETVNKEDGSRFLLELVVELSQNRELINTSEYVYLPTGSKKLCHTSNFQWRRGVRVYLVVAVKNLSFWIKHLMQNMEEIYAATRDDNFYLVVTDYSSEDANVEETMSKSSFKNWHVITKTGDFSRSAGLQAAIDYVTDPDSIVMTIDMHLTLPTGFVEAVRRHTIQAKMAYTPYFFRLNKGYSEVNYNGFWETLTYGLFGMFKSDWTNFGGFNLKKYKDKWGGEDWDILDRSLAKGYEAFRVRVPGLVHYQHTKAGMWGGKAHD